MAPFDILYGAVVIGVALVVGDVGVDVVYRADAGAGSEVRESQIALARAPQFAECAICGSRCVEWNKARDGLPRFSDTISSPSKTC
jgi:hypothetical protein